MLKAEFWIKLAACESRFGRWEIRGTPKASKTKPQVDRQEIAVKLSFDVPESYFVEPQVTVKAMLPEPNGQTVVSAEIKEGIANVISSKLGVKVHISADDGEKPEEQEDDGA